MIKTPSQNAAYNFNGNANDESGNGANATVINASLVNTPFGQGYSFNGSSNYIRLTQTNYDYSKGITISCWVNPVNITTNRYYEICRKEDNNYRILLSFQEYGTILAFGIYIYGLGYYEHEITINPADYVNKWTCIAVSYDNSLLKTYVNGVLKGSYNYTSYIVNSGTSFMFIGTSSGASEFFNGTISQLLFYKKALSDTDIKRIYEGYAPLNG